MAKETTTTKKKRFKSRTAPLAMRERTGYGTSGFITKPMYVPDDLEIAWATTVKKDDGNDLSNRMGQGFDMATWEMVTDDLDKAVKEGLICFDPAVYTALGDIDGGIGLMHHGLILLFRPKEVGEVFRKRQLETFDRMVNAAAKDTDGSISKKKSKLDKSGRLHDLAT